MFSGRQFDIETGLYYYRARYYNPYLGRFLQTDPVGYGYGYCGNNPVGCVDPSGMVWYTWEPAVRGGYFFRCSVWATDSDMPYLVNGEPLVVDCCSIGSWVAFMSNAKDDAGNLIFDDAWKKDQVGYKLSGNGGWSFWWPQALNNLGFEPTLRKLEKAMKAGVAIHILRDRENMYIASTNTVYWNPESELLFEGYGVEWETWHYFPSVAGLAHELWHVKQDLDRRFGLPDYPEEHLRRSVEKDAIRVESTIRLAVRRLTPELFKETLKGGSWRWTLVGRTDYYPDEYWRRKRGSQGYFQ